MGRRALGRSGLTLVELLVALTVTTIAGAALIKVMLAQNRASGTNEAWRVARAVSRGSLNRLLADLSIAEAEGALDGLTVDGRDITLRVRTRSAVACNTTLPLAATMLPVDDAAVGARPALPGLPGATIPPRPTATARLRSAGRRSSAPAPVRCAARPALPPCRPRLVSARPVAWST
jgi:hypothetical protein